MNTAQCKELLAALTEDDVKHLEEPDEIVGTPAKDWRRVTKVKDDKRNNVRVYADTMGEFLGIVVTDPKDAEVILCTIVWAEGTDGPGLTGLMKDSTRPWAPPTSLADFVFWFAVHDMGDGPEDYVIVTPRGIWDREKRVCDQSSADDFVDPLGLYRLTESVYEFSASKASVHAKLIAGGATEVTPPPEE